MAAARGLALEQAAISTPKGMRANGTPKMCSRGRPIGSCLIATHRWYQITETASTEHSKPSASALWLAEAPDLADRIAATLLKLAGDRLR